MPREFWKYHEQIGSGWYYDYYNKAGNYASYLYKIEAFPIEQHFMKQQTLNKRVIYHWFLLKHRFDASFENEYKSTYNE